MVEFEKLYNEIFAMLSLKYFWRDYSDGYKKGESPDWYNSDDSVGIEVTQAIMQEDGEAQSVVNQYLGRQKAEIPEDILRRYEGRTYFYNDRLWAIMPEAGKEENLTACEKALYRLGKKLERLNTNYTEFNTNALYLYLHESDIADEEIICLMRSAEKKGLCKKVRYGFPQLCKCAAGSGYEKRQLGNRSYTAECPCVHAQQDRAAASWYGMAGWY